LAPRGAEDHARRRAGARAAARLPTAAALRRPRALRERGAAFDQPRPLTHAPEPRAALRLPRRRPPPRLGARRPPILELHRREHALRQPRRDHRPRRRRPRRQSRARALRHRETPMMRHFAFALATLLVLPHAALAGGAEELVIDDFASFSRGTLEGTILHGRGEVSVGHRFERFELEDAFVAYALVRAPDGRVFVGTGPNGLVYALDGTRLARFAETGTLLVASLAPGPDGTLYAGPLPDARVLALHRAGEA